MATSSLRRELAAEHRGAGGNLTEDFAFILERTEHGLIVVVVADELKRGLFHEAVPSKVNFAS